MKISEFLKINPSLDIDMMDKEIIQKYLIDVEKTTNGLLTCSKLFGTFLAFYCNESNKNSKIVYEIAEKLLK